MPISLVNLCDELLPGLYNVIVPEQWTHIYVPVKPHIWVPKLTLPQAAAVGTATAVIKNPVISRRFWQGWSF